MAVAALGLLLTAAGAGQRPLVVICPGPGEVAAVSMVARAPEGEIFARQSGATALLSEMLTLRMSRALAGEDSLLARAMPAQRGVEVGFEPDYVAVTVAVVRKALPEAVSFLRRLVVDKSFEQADLEAAREKSLKRRDDWSASVVEHTVELMLQALSGGKCGQPLYGTPDSLRDASLEQLTGLWREMLQPGNLCISVEGIGPEEQTRLDEQVAALTRALPASEERVGTSKSSWRPLSGVKVEDNPSLGQASVVVGFAVEPFGRPGYWAARVLREMLAGPSGALAGDRALASKLGLVLPASLTWQDWPLQALEIEVSGRPYLAVHAVTYPAAVHVAAEGIVEHVRAIAEGKLTERELQRARRCTVNRWARETARIGDRTVLRGVAALLGEELPSPGQVAAVVAGLRRSELQAVARQMLKTIAIGVQMPRD